MLGNNIFIPMFFKGYRNIINQTRRSKMKHQFLVLFPFGSRHHSHWNIPHLISFRSLQTNFLHRRYRTRHGTHFPHFFQHLLGVLRQSFFNIGLFPFHHSYIASLQKQRYIILHNSFQRSIIQTIGNNKLRIF